MKRIQGCALILLGALLMASVSIACFSSQASREKIPVVQEKNNTASVQQNAELSPDEILERVQWQVGTVVAEVFFQPSESSKMPPVALEAGRGFFKDPRTVIFTEHQYTPPPNLPGRPLQIYYYLAVQPRNEIYTLNGAQTSSSKDLVVMRDVKRERSLKEANNPPLPPIIDLPIYQGEMSEIQKVYVIGDMGACRISSRAECQPLKKQNTFLSVIFIPMWF